MESHGPEAREAVSHAVGSVPFKICSSARSDTRRPRYYWVNFPRAPARPGVVQLEEWLVRPGVGMPAHKGQRLPGTSGKALAGGRGQEVPHLRAG
eukprot:9823164-Lingulodinium_polyedra.AAC.1